MGGTTLARDGTVPAGWLKLKGNNADLILAPRCNSVHRFWQRLRCQHRRGPTGAFRIDSQASEAAFDGARNTRTPAIARNFAVFVARLVLASVGVRRIKIRGSRLAITLQAASRCGCPSCKPTPPDRLSRATGNVCSAPPSYSQCMSDARHARRRPGLTPAGAYEG